MSGRSANPQRNKAKTALFLCLALMLSCWTTACSFACETLPKPDSTAHAAMPMPSHSRAATMAMDGDHTCCPHASAHSASEPLVAAQGSDCHNSDALIAQTIGPGEPDELRSPVAEQIFAAPFADHTQLRSLLRGLPLLTADDPHWPPGSHRLARSIPTSLDPVLTQIQV